jgi:hypothetical protein
MAERQKSKRAAPRRAKTAVAVAAPRRRRAGAGDAKAERPDADGADGGDSEGPGRSSAMGLEVDDEVLEFIAALERFKKANNRPFPGWSEVLHVLKQLGYRR